MRRSINLANPGLQEFRLVRRFGGRSPRQQVWTALTRKQPLDNFKLELCLTLHKPLRSLPSFLRSVQNRGDSGKDFVMLDSLLMRFGAKDSMDANSDSCSTACSLSIQPANPQSSGEDLLHFLSAQLTQRFQPAQNPYRFIEARTRTAALVAFKATQPQIFTINLSATRAAFDRTSSAIITSTHSSKSSSEKKLF